MKKIKKLMSLFLLVFCLICLSACNSGLSVKLNFEDGSLYKELNVEKGVEVSLDTPTKEGYTFKGWYIANDLVEAPYVFEDDVVLVAKFDINMYTYIPIHQIIIV